MENRRGRLARANPGCGECPLVDEAEVTRLAARWRGIVELQQSQEARVREFQPRYDRWAPLASLFAPGDLTPDIEAVVELVQEGETWLDVGCGAGRFAAHLATRAGTVLCNDSSSGMTEALREAARERSLDNIKVLPAAPWPVENVGGDVDVVFSAHVLYFVTDIVPFLKGMEAQARRRCVVLIGDEAGSLPPGDAWYAAHHEPMSRLPALDEFTELMEARGIKLDVQDVPMHPNWADGLDPEEAFAMLRNRCHLREEDSPKARRLRQWFDEQREATGKNPPLMAMQRRAICSWDPTTP